MGEWGGLHRRLMIVGAYGRHEEARAHHGGSAEGKVLGAYDLALWKG